MQRKKSFLVVCILTVFVGEIQAQNVLAGAFNAAPDGIHRLAIRGTNRSFVSIPVAFIPVLPILLSGITVPGARISIPNARIAASNPGLSLYQAVFSPENTAASRGRQNHPSQQALENDYHTMDYLSMNPFQEHFGFFCKKELEFEKMTRIPLRFRLGSLEQCNYLEGKK